MKEWNRIADVLYENNIFIYAIPISALSGVNLKVKWDLLIDIIEDTENKLASYFKAPLTDGQVSIYLFFSYINS